ncbi:MAG: DNA-3-methyladenine glycosylase [Bryobacterales bacterium]|nr:DNA-3-methyladenine glycosylase [Bryobacteraceae bacterium]MDW8131461.1 DNA-3-methyladenine glycosylase [Bryobacterales bacterium]
MRQAIRHLKSADPVMARLIEQVGPYRIEYSPPDYQTLAKAIVLQQLSGKAAAAIFRRLLVAAGDGKLTPGRVLDMDPGELRLLGLSRQKIAYLRGLAQRVVSGELDFKALERAPDAEVLRQLTSIRGIGVWTAQMFLIFALRRPDVMPSQDLGIRVAVQKAYGLARLPGVREVDAMAERWKPYRSVASWYLWRSLEDQAGL